MTRKLFTLAYPTLSVQDKRYIEEFRILHDGHANLVEAHFTMVFGVDENTMSEERYISHIEKASAESQTTPFHCRYAMVGADRFSETAYVYLVPDEGFSKLSLLHDRLYSGSMASQLRLDIEYVPHITIGSCTDRDEAKRLCHELNSRGVSVSGTVDTLTVAALANGKLKNLSSFALGAGDMG